ncbi:MAG: apolipoprotein N-acyltransferase [Deltaproteobacteria bacterium]|jgi:apolipoprotein N-acyltransferase|nr:apolipoprotein N-acyltransferase [Deltaproteobacteria bacterium]MBW2535122.1 apolipoprotein N-acyltransferase [Deltaproteobacteria bacterium]
MSDRPDDVRDDRDEADDAIDAEDSTGDDEADSDGDDETDPDGEADEDAEPSSWKPQAVVGPTAAYGLALLTGVLYFLGFPGMDNWPVAFVALVPMIVALHGQPVRRATGIGWLAGFTMTMIGFYWLLEMLKVFSGFGTAICVLFMALLCGYQAGRIALCGLLYGLATRRGWPAPWVFAGAFVASELVYPLLFPWYFGASVHNAPVFGQVADIGGPYLVGLVLALANLAIAELVIAKLFRQPIRRSVIALGVAAPLVAALYGAWRISAVEGIMEQSEPVKVGMVQGNNPLKGRHQSIPNHLRLTRQLREQGAELVVWSEGAVSGFFPHNGYERAVRHMVSRHLGVPTIIGTVLNERLPGTGPKGRNFRFFNVALMADAKGKIVGRYDKQFLLMFGEYLPFGQTFPILYQYSPNSGRFTPGTSLAPLELDGHRYATTICYEDISPSFVNDMVREGDPDMLVNMTNDAWFGDTTEPWIHLALAKMRSIEHRRYLVRVTNSGVSAIVDPIGRVVVHGGTFREEALLGTARYLTARTVYRTLGDLPWWLVTAAMVGAAIVRRPRRKTAA